MPFSISFAWRTAAYVAVQIIILLGLERISKQRLPRALWHWVILQAAVVVASSLAEVVPYYVWGSTLPQVVRFYKNLVVMLFLLGALVAYLKLWRDWVSHRPS